jgi:hypothetical protein
MTHHQRMAAGTSTRFIGYPVDRMLAAFTDAVLAAEAATALRAIGLADRHITILRGDEGAARLDGSGEANGPIARLRRLVSFTVMDQLPDFAYYEQAVRDGGAVLMVRVRGDRMKRAGLEALRAHGGHFINYYGRFATEELERWHGPEPDIPSLMRR